MRTYIFITIILSGFWCWGCFAQDSSTTETNIYHEYIEKISNLPLEGGESDYREASARIEKEIGDKYGLSAEQVDRITDRAKNNLTDFEWRVFDELSMKLRSLPQSANKEDYNQVWAQVANKYGISKSVLTEIMYKGTQSMLTGRRGLTRWERLIFNDYDTKIRALPESATPQDCEIVRQEVLSKYGIDDHLLDRIIKKVFKSQF